ncbi:MAG: biotin/lipoyl-binding protein [Acidobacteria bacterium]|nr:biotin/lipoyl-binding protein [Acidobacteriota bacterium]MBI3279294.1 biotin/lipoyl-binding protein [Acidobacteriota bacterium]
MRARTVHIGGRQYALEWERNGDRCRYRLTAPGVTREGEASVIEVEPGRYSVLLEGRSFEAAVNAGTVEIAGHSYSVAVEDPRAARRPRDVVHEGHETVAAPMPGKVVKVLVAEGDEVKRGQGIVIVEAMKMQNEMKSPRPGRVLSLRAVEGATVSAGDVLAVVE